MVKSIKRGNTKRKLTNRKLTKRRRDKRSGKGIGSSRHISPTIRFAEIRKQKPERTIKDVLNDTTGKWDTKKLIKGQWVTQSSYYRK